MRTDDVAASHGEPATAGGFAASASAGLAQTAGALREMRDAVGSGRVHISLDGAEALLTALGRVHDRATGELRELVGEVDRPLHFGDNWVGQIMEQRFRGAATGGEHAVGAVLERFNQLLRDTMDTIRTATGQYVATDEHAAEDLARSERRGTEHAP